MILLAAVLAVLAAAFAAQAAVLTDQLRVARLELAVLARRLASTTASPAVSAAPSPLRKFECRLERRGLLWFPVLTASDDEKLVSGVASGLPHCANCVQPLSLAGGLEEQWACPGCHARHPSASADLMATDAVLADCLREFFARHPDYSPAPGLSAPKVQTAAA
jgi:hypothetical protein